jgi:hypothetical protein
MLPPPRPVVPPLALAAAGALPALCALPAALRAGGLAPVFCAAVVAGFVGAPLAGQEWRADRPDPLRQALAETATAAWAAAAVASLAADWRAPAGPVGGAWFAGATALGALFAGQAVARRPWGRRALLGLLAAATAAALWPTSTVDGTGGAVPALPWTLLEPRFGGWRDWAPGAVAAGVLSAGAGVGALSLARRDPGEWRAPWGAVGVGLLIALAGSVRAGTTFAAALGDPGPDAGWLVLGGATLAAAGPALVRRPLLVAAAGAWLCGPAAGALPFVTTVAAPLVSAALLARIGAGAAGAERAAGWGAGALLAGVAAVAGRWPTELGPAAAVGALLVAVFWWVATRLAIAPREAS